jgi:hypothetical protein
VALGIEHEHRKVGKECASLPDDEHAVAAHGVPIVGDGGSPASSGGCGG